MVALSSNMFVTFIPVGTIHPKFVVKSDPFTIELVPDATQVVERAHSKVVPDDNPDNVYVTAVPG